MNSYFYSNALRTPYLETGGHVFQLLFTNSQSMNTNGVFGTSTGEWGESDVYFGFNLARSF